MANKRVQIYDIDGEYRAHPPLHELDGGGTPDKFVVRNNTQEDIVVFVGPKAFHATDAVSMVVPSGKARDMTAVSQGAGSVNVYPYHVLALKSGKKAKGNSDPVLIIEN